MECGCSIDIDCDGGGPECGTIKDRKARKEHKCCECNRTILKGEVYRDESGIWEGKPDCFKTCKDCLSVRDVYFCGFEYGRLWECLTEEIRESDMLDGRLKSVTVKACFDILGIHQDKWDEEDGERLWTDYAVRLTEKFRVVQADTRDGDRFIIKNIRYGINAPQWTQERAAEMNTLREYLNDRL